MSSPCICVEYSMSGSHVHDGCSMSSSHVYGELSMFDCVSVRSILCAAVLLYSVGVLYCNNNNNKI